MVASLHRHLAGNRLLSRVRLLRVLQERVQVQVAQLKVTLPMLVVKPSQLKNKNLQIIIRSNLHSKTHLEALSHPLELQRCEGDQEAGHKDVVDQEGEIEEVQVVEEQWQIDL